MLPGREIPDSAWKNLSRWLGHSTSGEGFLPFSLAFIFEKDILYRKKIHLSSSISRVLQDHKERRTGRGDFYPQLARRGMDRVTIPISVGQGTFKPAIQRHKGHAHRERAGQEKSHSAALEVSSPLLPLTATCISVSHTMYPGTIRSASVPQLLRSFHRNKPPGPTRKWVGIQWTRE